MDFDMDDPTNSIMWSSAFMGNGDGVVTSGPFGNWMTEDNIPLIRNIGSTGSLLSKNDVQDVLSRTYHYQINEGTAEVRYSLEGHHDGVHRWMDGQMAGLHTSPQDPIFFLHHSFIDYIWYHFRIRQKFNGIDPYADYPPTNLTLHEPFRPMAAFAPLRNIDGYSNFWDDILEYEDSATCSNGCGSLYLQCVRGRCVSKDTSFLNEPVNQDSRSSVNRDKKMSLSKQRALALGPLPIGKQFNYYLTDIRTRNDSMPVRARIKNPEYQGPIPFASILHKMLLQWNSVREKIGNHRQAKAIPTVHRNKPFETGMTPGQNVNPSFQNTFLINNIADVNKWVFIPVRVLYKMPMYSKHMSNAQNIPTGTPKGYNKCRNRNTGTEKISVHSVGINYMGAYTGFAHFKQSSAISSSVTYVAVQNPENGVSKAIISAYDSCGRMCIPTCFKHGSNPPAFESCSGAIEVTGNSPKMFSSPELNHNVQNRYYEIPVSSRKNLLYLSFKCFYENSWPWMNCN
ncbi:hypothetical protein KUTeg_002885 [Tegillarca granosa]|uniref:Tyrosinase copper-binding domain-containing protein n=1 Tax=Tegillarca granosa TaxID=220873 RepID=A0ABQ9FQL0_TEGGR|nr:hypothetical protein KUTeg_002885 [Tegillarca granosa]